MATIFDMVDTWNNGATTFNAIKMNVTDTASAALSLLLDLQVGASSKFSVGKGGKLTIPAAVNENATAMTQSLTGANAQSILDLAATWNTSGTPIALKLDVTDTASNAASMLLDLMVGGASRFEVTKAGAALTAAGSASLPSYSFVGDTNTGLFNRTGDVLAFATGGTSRFELTTDSFRMASDIQVGWSSGTADTGADLVLFRDAADTLAQRRGTNAQTKRLYFSYTDNSNYTRMAFKTATGVHTIEAESAGTGEANIDLAFTPKGTGRVRFGTHSAIAAETVTGYITIKDAGGTSRKIAVVS